MLKRFSELRLFLLCSVAGIVTGLCASVVYATVPCPNNTCDQVDQVIYYVSGGVDTGVIYFVSPPPSSVAFQALVLKTDGGLGGQVTAQNYSIYKVESDFTEYCDIGTTGTRKGNCTNPSQSGTGVPKSKCSGGS